MGAALTAMAPRVRAERRVEVNCILVDMSMCVK
jgi:hypothetical protein